MLAPCQDAFAHQSRHDALLVARETEPVSSLSSNAALILKFGSLPRLFALAIVLSHTVGLFVGSLSAA